MVLYVNIDMAKDSYAYSYQRQSLWWATRCRSIRLCRSQNGQISNRQSALPELLPERLQWCHNTEEKVKSRITKQITASLNKDQVKFEAVIRTTSQHYIFNLSCRVCATDRNGRWAITFNQPTKKRVFFHFIFLILVVIIIIHKCNNLWNVIAVATILYKIQAISVYN